MPLMPADVRNVTFSKPSIGKRGYHEDEVDAFLDLVVAELTRLIDENTDLRNQVKKHDQQRRATPADTGNNLRPLGPPGRPIVPIRLPIREQTASEDDHNVQAVKVLGLAQEMAERLTGEAKTEADAMLTKAHATSTQLLAEARTKAEGMVTEAKGRAQTILNDARSQADALDRQSRDNAASLERDAARKHTEIIGSIDQEKKHPGKEDRRTTHLRTRVPHPLGDLPAITAARARRARTHRIRRRHTHPTGLGDLRIRCARRNPQLTPRRVADAPCPRLAACHTRATRQGQ
jgi:DivIVA domain-containing protein